MMKRVTEDELKQALADHLVWLDTNEKEGRKADFSGRLFEDVDLQGARFSAANFSGSKFKGCSFINAKLIGADFTNCEFDDVSFAEARLNAAVFSGSKKSGLLTFANAKITISQFESCLFDGADFSGSNGNRPKFQSASLEECSFSKAIFDGAEFMQSSLNNASFKSAELNSCSFDDVQAIEAVFDEAAMDGVRFSGGRLDNASFDDAIATNCYFAYADLGGASFRRSKMISCQFDEGKLFHALFLSATISRSTFRHCSMAEVHFGGEMRALGVGFLGAELDGAKFSGNFFDSNFTSASMLRISAQPGTSFEEARFRKAKMTGARLRGCIFINAGLHLADLSDSDLVQASFVGADLTGSRFEGANLKEAWLERANLAGSSFVSAKLQGVRLEGAENADDADWSGTEYDKKFLPAPKTAYGKRTRAVSKLAKQPLPMKAGAFKKLFPAEFDRVQEVAKGRDFTPELLSEIIDRFGFSWAVSVDSYRSDQQRICENANDVILLNVALSDEAYTDEQREILTAVKEMSQRSGHPVKKGKDFFTVGWVRYCDFPDRILVEEVQSDVGGVRKGLKDTEFVRELASSGLSAEQIDAAMALMQPFADRFYEDALGLIFDMAEEQGKKVEMLDYAQKEQFGSPRNVYTDLPKSMGMKLGPSQAMPKLGQVWTYTPNRRKRSR